MARTTTETIRVCERVLEFVRTNKSKTAAKKLNAAALHSDLSRRKRPAPPSARRIKKAPI